MSQNTKQRAAVPVQRPVIGTAQYTVTFTVEAPADPDLQELIEDAIRHYLLLEQWLVQTNEEIEAEKIEHAPINLNEESITVGRQADDLPVPYDPLTRLTAGLVPLVPNLEAREAIRRIFGTVGPGQNDRHMDHWNRGKTIQRAGGAVPFKHEEEHAVGLYDQELRPVLIVALLKWCGEHGAEIDPRLFPKATNELVAIHRGYRVEVDRETAQVEVYRPNLERARVWWFGDEKGEGTAGLPTFSQITDAIDRDIEKQAA